ncbi:hypothetical protein ASD24_02705 [Paenibacillus sp. Root52]|uniref:PBP1b-binding outer membrane lipoprotein LpoB n=2 Tax=Paenibacillus TaxID=44249 RepID=A0AAP5H181_PAEAM|nr:MULTISPECIES: hypothetical protein [Paenibacillus]KQY94484.1 hypothetical protein ASD24_02705 [Paenibacillus sp. Root52]MDR6724434.1 PBP1b-binding outer membrane lipoprotein LpoB [Paenibacillus amylolyticus]
MKKILITLIAICLILTGCFSGQTGNEQVNVNDKEKKLATENENNLTLDKVTAALKTEGIEMFKEEPNNNWVLNNVNANRFSVSRPNVKEVYKEYISVYIFSSEAARKEGLNDFNHQKEKYDMQIPNIYEYKNVLILYWHHENADNSKNAKFNKQIEMAIQKM